MDVCGRDVESGARRIAEEVEAICGDRSEPATLVLGSEQHRRVAAIPLGDDVHLQAADDIG